MEILLKCWSLFMQEITYILFVLVIMLHRLPCSIRKGYEVFLILKK